MTEPPWPPNEKGWEDILRVLDGEALRCVRRMPSAPPSSKRPPHVGSYFPAAGYRNNGDGAVNNVGSNGNWWSSCPNSTDNSRNLNFNSSNLNPLNNNNRANGFSVRPARIHPRRMRKAKRPFPLPGYIAALKGPFCSPSSSDRC